MARKKSLNSNNFADKTSHDTYYYYFNLLRDLAVNSFKWINLPSNIDPRWVELNLLERGFVLFFLDDVMNEFNILPCTIGGRLDLYNRPVMRRAYAANGYNYPTTIDDSVIIYNNYLHTPDIEAIDCFATRLMDAQRTADINISAQKTPYFVMGPEEMQFSLRNIMQKVQGYVQAIFTYKSFNPDDIKVFKTDAPFISDKIQTYKKQIFNEALTFLGIQNSNDLKKERLITSEADANTVAANANVLRRLNARLDACKLINDMFNLNISVEFQPQFIEGGGDDKNGELYNLLARVDK